MEIRLKLILRLGRRMPVRKFVSHIKGLGAALQVRLRVSRPADANRPS
jgi:hypothetical protein